ncbi:autotransporter assembly complex protein TamA [Pseudohalioglobus lutimaris]|uniref:Translocation and assembly module subunit TamA n=1 Tax=Pseudohalioglobus lutimaris TaxID=1737061 RepID=A0A2N5WXI3_9GAMM|nr:BamA/TamA family outer membrane protein [Pseudohalioglobus lutimaris]PLW66949.1 hypothetical protein C0039_19260 [Pseudohalioglobus lutimaris]
MAIAPVLAALFALLLCVQTSAQAALQVQVDGLRGVARDNVRASLSIARRQQDPELDAATIQALHDQAELEISRALEPFGYYRPQITSLLQPPTESSPDWRARYQIDAGEKIPIAEMQLTVVGAGQNNDEVQALSEGFPLRRDSTLDHRRYEHTKRELMEQLRNLGYLDAVFTAHKVEVDMATYSARIALRVDTGPGYVFGPITFAQNQFATDYLQHYLVITPGQPFDPAAISRQRTALSKSGHFREVTIVTGEPADAERPAIPLHIQLTPFKPNRYRGRLGWGTDYGFGVQLDWTRRYVGKRGHYFNLGGSVVEERQRLAGDASYTIPLDPLSGGSLEIAARHESKDLTFEEVDLDEGGESRIATNIASLIWHRPNRQWSGFEFRHSIGLSLVGETYDVFEVLFGNLPSRSQDDLIDVIGPEAYNTLAPDFEALVPRLQLNFRRSDDPLYIRRGDFYNLELLGTEESFGSNTSFWQARLNTWNILPVGDRNRLLLRSAWGYTDAESKTALGINFNQVPEYFEFRAGGARSVRGYGFEELFAADTITGGKHLAVASVEYEHEFISNFSAAVFLDAGNAFNDFDDIDEKLGAGFGLRWRSPVGLARIDVGFPLDDAEDSFQIYITVGPEF